jgi:hypothetical protein
MRSHISVQRDTSKYFSNSFVFKNKIEKEGLPRDSPAGLGAGGPEFKSRRPDQFMFFVSHHLETPVVRHTKIDHSRSDCVAELMGLKTEQFSIRISYFMVVR